MEKIDFKDISFIVQGPIYENYTHKVCESIRKYAPGAEIVVSTWLGSKRDGLDCDLFIENEDPGNFLFVLPEVMDNGSNLYPMNVNRQIISTVNGLKSATRKYACKLRSDLVLTGTNFLNYYLKYDASICQPYHSALMHRVVTLTSVNPRRYNPFAYYLCDWFFFGLRGDLINIWDIPLIMKNDLVKNPVSKEYLMTENYGNEQYIWMGFLKKIQNIHIQNGYEINDEIICDSEKSYANCCIFATAKNANVYSLKIGKKGYGDKTSFSNAGLYTENDWIRMYNTFCGANEKCGNDIWEHLEYNVARLLRGLRKTRFKGLYLNIKRIVK